MTIAPIVQTVTVKAAPARAFDLFAHRMADWWPRGKTIGQNPHVDVVLEPHTGGRWYERDADGAETDWGQVLAWEPPGRLLLGWQLNARFAYDPDPEVMTEVEMTFAPIEGGGTRVTLEHRHLERLGADAVAYRETLNNGWPTMMKNLADLADAES